MAAPGAHGDPRVRAGRGARVTCPAVPTRPQALALTCLAWAAGAGVATASPVVSLPPPAPAVWQVTPGISVQRLVEPGPQVVHVLRAQRTGLVGVSPILVGGATSRRGGLADALAARSASGAAVAVNADFFNNSASYPSGITITRGEGLASEPEPTRSALLFGPDGALSAARLTMTGRWQTVDAAGAPVGTLRTFAGINRPAERTNETLLYSPAFGARTPTGSARTEAVIATEGTANLTANTPVLGTVRQVTTGGGTELQPGTLVVSGVGTAGNLVGRDLVQGARVRVDPAIAGLAPDTLAVGGGPLLVDAGAAVPSAGEGFTPGQLSQRTTRTAIGQANDGTYLLVVAEGPPQGSRGITVPEQAALMQRLGARLAVAMDAGGSAQLVLDGVAAVPWSSPRSITTGVVVSYAGVRVAPLLGRITPNADGLDDRTVARVTAPQAGRLVVTMARRGNAERHTLLDRAVTPGTVLIPIDPVAGAIADGPYRLTAELAPDGGAATLAGRDLLIDRTLAQLRVRAARQRVGKKRVPVVRIAFRLQRPARVTVRVLTTGGTPLRTVWSNRLLGAGTRLVVWNRRVGRALVDGEHRIEVVARTSLGRPGLSTTINLAPVRPTPKPAPTPTAGG